MNETTVIPAFDLGQESFSEFRRRIDSLREELRVSRIAGAETLIRSMFPDTTHITCMHDAVHDDAGGYFIDRSHLTLHDGVADKGYEVPFDWQIDNSEFADNFIECSMDISPLDGELTTEDEIIDFLIAHYYDGRISTREQFYEVVDAASILGTTDSDTHYMHTPTPETKSPEASTAEVPV